MGEIDQMVDIDHVVEIDHVVKIDHVEITSTRIRADLRNE